MRPYNIAILCESDTLMDCHGNYLDYEGGIDYLRALNRISEHNITHINDRETYALSGQKKAMKIISESLHKNMVDIVIVSFDAEFLYPIEFFSELKQSFFMVMLAGDDLHYHEKNHKYYSQVFDLVLTHDLLCSRRYEMFGVEAIPQPGFYDVRDFKNHQYEKIYDVCFVGEIKRKVRREGYLRHLVDNGINVNISGSGTAGGMVSRDEMHRIHASSKIGLSFSGGSLSSALDMDITINRRMRVPKGRDHEIAMAGSFLLAEYSPGIEEFYDIGSEIDVFRNKGELLAKIEYYLKNDDLREQMAKKAYEKAIRECDEINAWKKILAVIDKKIELKNSGTFTSEMGIYKDPIFKKAYSAFHLYKMLKFIQKGKLGKALEEFVIVVKYPFFDGGVFLAFFKESVVGYLGGVRWLRNVVRRIKCIIAKGNHVNKI